MCERMCVEEIPVVLLDSEFYYFTQSILSLLHNIEYSAHECQSLKASQVKILESHPLGDIYMVHSPMCVYMVLMCVYIVLMCVYVLPMC